MSLNNSHMLPDKVRSMRQMKDVLEAEDIILAEIEEIIDEMYERAVLLHEELINETWLEDKLSGRTGSNVEVMADAEKLFVEIIMDVSGIQSVNMPDVRKFLNKWLPAHLMYKFKLIEKFIAENKGNVSVQTMKLHLRTLFWRCRIWDGSWLLDGTVRADSARIALNAGMRLRVETCFEAKKADITVFFDNQWKFDGIRLLDGTKKFAGTWEEKI